MNVEVVGRLRPPVASDRKLDAGGLASNAGNGNLSIEGNQRLVNKLAGNSFTYVPKHFSFKDMLTQRSRHACMLIVWSSSNAVILLWRFANYQNKTRQFGPRTLRHQCQIVHKTLRHWCRSVRTLWHYFMQNSLRISKLLLQM